LDGAAAAVDSTHCLNAATKSDLASGEIGLPVLRASITSAKSFGMAMNTGRFRTFSKWSLVMVPLLACRLMTILITSSE
jgi:hypothetical protein